MKKSSTRTLVTNAMAFSLFFINSTWADETSVTQQITQLNYDANADYLYMIGPSKWGAPSCPTATYAMVTSTVVGRKQLLAIAIAAKSSGALIKLIGTCNGGDYFNVTYIVVQS